MRRQTFPRLRRRLYAISTFPLLPALLYVPALRGQTVNFGVKIGVPVTDYFETGSTESVNGSAHYTSTTRRYTFGLTGELRLKNALGLEVDALYHRFSYNGTINNFNSANGNFSNTSINVFGNSWDFPVMVKYRSGFPLHPYVAGGPVLRWIASARETGSETTGSPYGTLPTFQIGTNNISDFRKSLYPGVTAVGGVELARGRLRLLPEFRYTRWTANISGPGGLLRFDPNQAEFVVGTLF